MNYLDPILAIDLVTGPYEHVFWKVLIAPLGLVVLVSLWLVSKKHYSWVDVSLPFIIMAGLAFGVTLFGVNTWAGYQPDEKELAALKAKKETEAKKTAETEKAAKEKGASLMYNLRWMLTDLEKYQELMPLVPSDLQLNIRRYVYRTGMAIAQASDDGSSEMDIVKLRIGAAEHIYLTLVWDAFKITDDPDLLEVSPQGNQINGTYGQGQNESNAESSFLSAEA